MKCKYVTEYFIFLYNDVLILKSNIEYLHLCLFLYIFDINLGENYSK